ncbi:MAG TPA: PD-(D/E)XK nuclease family protein, partial [Chthonomonadales bacterium]|nr:PD-(D/E)XK nuclease family protein [Chthonomonadales bacterium]
KGDPFLPDSLRARLGIADNSRRYARDAYFLTCIVESKKTFRAICGVRGVDGDPLLPSRFLFACSDRELLARAKAIAEFQPPERPYNPLRGGSAYRIGPFRPDATRRLESIRVTAFRTYLACPFRFYLAHVLQLSGVEQETEELDGGRFGTLLHDALSAFAKDDLHGVTDAGAIEAALNSALDESAARMFGTEAAPIVGLQINQARRRLKRFAEWETQQRSAGWKTVRCEQEFELKLEEGVPSVRGRIDRIDFHPDQGYRIIDYKSGDSKKTPKDTHLAKKNGATEWVDLQLPLYHLFWRRHLEQQGEWPRAISLGYCLLPSDLEKPETWSEAEWSTEDLEAACCRATAVARDISEGKFWPPGDAPPYPDEFSAICMDRCPDRNEILSVGRGDDKWAEH